MENGAIWYNGGTVGHVSHAPFDMLRPAMEGDHSLGRQTRGGWPMELYIWAYAAGPYEKRSVQDV